MCALINLSRISSRGKPTLGRSTKTTEQIQLSTREGTTLGQTKINYLSHNRIFLTWLNEHHPSAVSVAETGDISFNLPILDSHIMEFFDVVKYKTDGFMRSNSDKGNFRSGLVQHYKNNQIDFSKQVLDYFTDYFKTSKRESSAAKISGEIKLTEGKNGFTPSGYRNIIGLGMGLEKYKDVVRVSDYRQHLFIPLYHVYSYNLVARAITVAHIKFAEMCWVNDMMVINMGPDKGDSDGSKKSTFYPKHIAANPHDPLQCPISQLGINCMCTLHVEQEQFLFGGSETFSSKEQRFSKNLMSLLKSLTDEQCLQLVGDIAKNLGTHSNRKSASSRLCSDPGGPGIISVFKRTGWNLGDVLERYLKAGEGGDQTCARLLCGLTLTDKNFACLAPHFTASLEIEAMRDIMLGYDTYPSSFKTIIPYLIASVTWHSAWYDEHLSSNHPLRQSRYWLHGWRAKLLPLIVSGVGACSITGMFATGIPPQIIIACQIQGLENKLDAAIEKIGTFDEALKDRTVSGIDPVLVVQFSEQLQNQASVKMCDGLDC